MEGPADADPGAPTMATGEDGTTGISDLPDGVLHHILSLAPAQDAARTCVLAQSWRHHWRFAPAVRIAGSSGWAGGVNAFVLFVHGLLHARRLGGPLDTCDLDLDFDLAAPDLLRRIERHGNSWIRRALRLQVLELRFRVELTPRQPFTLEERALASVHLKTLELVGVKGNASVLDFSGCPALQDLTMEDCEVGSLDMHSPSVRHLTIRYCLFYCNYRTRMSFPSLVSFQFITNVGRVPMLESMLSLETATVRYDHFYDDQCTNGRLDDCGDAACGGCSYYYGPDDYDCVFLEGLTEATYLNLTSYPQMYVFYRDLQWCPPFSKLKTLVLEDWFVCAELSALIWFVLNAPLLEKLTLIVPSKVSKNLMKTGGRYDPSGKTSASCHLKLVEIICKEVDWVVLKIVKILNANGIPLENIRIQCSEGFNFVCTDVSSN